MKLINPNDIPFVLAPIAPLLPGEPVHYESVAFQQVVGMIRRIEAEPVKHAHWIKSNYDNVDGTIYKCSNCNAELFSAWNYCPNCGAKMEVGENAD